MKKTHSLSVISLCLPYKEDPHWFSDTGFLWWMEIVCYRNTWAKKRTYVRGVEFCAFLCCSELLFHIGGGSCDPFTKELWGLVKELLNWSCKDCLLDDWGQLVASFIHCYHGLAVVGEIEIAVIMVEVLVLKGPGVEDIAPYDLYDKGYELSSCYGQVGMAREEMTITSQPR